MLRRLVPIIALLCLVFLLTAPVFAQEATPEATPVVGSNPTPVVATVNGNPVAATLIAPVGTPVPVDQPKPFDVNVVLPYLGGALVVAVLGIIAVAGTALLFLFRSTPAAQFLSRTVLPPLGDAGVTAYEDYAKLTPQTFDDDLAKQLRTEWEAYKQQLTSDVVTKNEFKDLSDKIEVQKHFYPVSSRQLVEWMNEPDPYNTPTAPPTDAQSVG